MSDLRFMIDADLREARIVLAFPQRDIHIDSTAVPAMIVSSSPGPSAGTVPASPAQATSRCARIVAEAASVSKLGRVVAHGRHLTLALARADVHTTRGLSEHQQTRLGLEPSSKEHLLLVATR